MMKALLRDCWRMAGVTGCLVLLTLTWMLCGAGLAQDSSGRAAEPSAKAQAVAAVKAPTQADGQVVGDTDQPAPALPKATTVEERSKVAWGMLSDALGDAKHSQTRIQALAALSLLR